MFQSKITAEEIAALELRSFGGETVVIDSLGDEFGDAIRYLKRQKVIGFDTETRPSFSPDAPHYGISLLQLSSSDRAFLFRINRIGMPHRLCALLANGNIVKVGAAVHDDIKGLQKVHGFTAASMVDLQKEVGQYGIQDLSVKKMTAIILGFKISKTQQLSNWENETLTEAQKRYAATDAWVCLEMYRKLQTCEKISENNG